MNDKVTLVSYEYMLENYVSLREGHREPSNEALASAFKFKFNGIVKPEWKMNNALVRLIHSLSRQLRI